MAAWPCSMPLPALDDVKAPMGDVSTGVNILRVALEAPMRKIVENAGMNGDVIIQNVRRMQDEKKDAQRLHNVMTGEYLNMVKSGIVDPAKVTRGAVGERIASIAP